MHDPFGFGDRGGLVIGAGQGMGREAALLLARLGARLALVDVEAERGEAVAKEVRALGTSAAPLSFDVTDAAQVRAGVEAAIKELGRIDVLINIVGMAGWGPLLDIEPEDWDRDVLLNLKQHFLVCREVGRHMRDAGGGAISVVASVSGLFAAPNHGPYGAAKSGVMALVRTMSQEWEPHGIRVNAVAPGSVRTPRIMAMRESGEIAESDPRAAGRESEPLDIANALVFLVSDMARRINGQVIVVDGGTIARFPFGDMERTG